MGAPACGIALAAFLLALFAVLCIDHRVQAACLPDAILEEKLQNIVVDGISMPLGFWNGNWDSGNVVGAVVRLICVEALGFRINITGSDDVSSLPGLLALAGCTRKRGDLRCTENVAANPHHVAVEFWQNYNPVEEAWIQTNYPERFPHSFKLGYVAVDELFLATSEKQAAYSARGLALQYYTSYDVAWNKAQDFFDSYTSIPASKLAKCTDTKAGAKTLGPLVQQFALDPAGFDPSGAANCPDGHWWFAPSCRSTPDECIPVLTGGNGWMLDGLMQRAIAFNMPLALATAASRGDYVSLPFAHRCLFLSWEPSTHFLERQTVQVMFPENDHPAEGDKRNRAPTTVLSTLVHQALEKAAPRAYGVLQQVQFSQADVMAMLTELKGGGRPEDVACKWLLNNTRKWREWLPKDDPTDCLSGQGLVSSSGEFARVRAEASACSPCVAGFFASKLTDDRGLTHTCQACAVGQSQPMWGSETCTVCSEGYFQDIVGQSACMRCAKGSYATGLGHSVCTECSGGKTTDGTGFRFASDCQCPPGTYQDAGSGACMTCSRGSTCRGFGAAPEASPGFQLSQILSDGLSVFACFGDPRRCPGGYLGTCASGRRGIACAECEPDMSPADNGSCEPCGRSDVLPFVAAIVSACLCLALVYYKVNAEDRARQSYSGWLITMVLGQSLSNMQLVGAVSKISVPWPEPARSCMKFLKGLAFDPEILRLGCVASFSAIDLYMLRLCTLPLGIAVLVCTHLVVATLRYGGRLRERLGVLVGSMGVVVMSLFITICSWILSPFRCTRNPNGKWTMVEYEVILCWDSAEHIGLLVAGCIALNIPILFITSVIHLLRSFPGRMSAGDVGFLNRYAFIFARVKPASRWFMLVFLLRNLVVATLPSIPNAFWQTFLMSTVFVLSMCGTLRFEPWKMPLLNAFDVLSNLFLLAVTGISMAFLQNVDLQAVPEIMLIIVVSVLVMLPIALIWCLVRHMRPKAKPFRWFICHQKSSAGTFARLMKIALAESKTCAGGVFLDSDNLGDLATLFNVVKSDVKTLLVLCTRDVFSSPWCLGELTTAFVSHVDTAPVHFSDFRVPSGEFISNIASLVDLSCLVESGLGVGDVEGALRFLSALAHISMPPLLSEVGLAKITAQIASTDARRDLVVATSTSSAARRSITRSTVILVDTTIEAVSASMIFLKLLFPLVAHDPHKLPMLLEHSENDEGIVVPEKTTVVVLFCTAGCFASVNYLLGLIHMVRLKITSVVPVVAAEHFDFPDNVFYAALDKNVGQFCTSLCIQKTANLLTPLVTAIFRKIVMRFSVMDTIDILQVQTKRILNSLEDTERMALSLETTTKEQSEIIKQICERAHQVRDFAKDDDPGTAATTPEASNLLKEETNQEDMEEIRSL
mmetsp:Transcript_58431/g.167702  ORF Transcript_58431/g.167702 Transcript_58431/m.167702 type:complete len:1388 (-) Transcript_58431:294-4457(-)